MVVPEVVVENIHPEDFTMDNLLEKEMMEEVSIVSIKVPCKTIPPFFNLKLRYS